MPMIFWKFREASDYVKKFLKRVQDWNVQEFPKEFPNK